MINARHSSAGRPKLNVVGLAISAVVASFVADAVRAQTAWTGGTDAVWGNPANWDTGVPTGSTTVIISRDDNPPGFNPNQPLPLANQPVLDGATGSASSMFLGSLAGAELTIRTGGQLTTNSATIGVNSTNGFENNRLPEQSGTLTVTGTGSRFSSGSVSLGRNGTGTARFSEGAALDVTGALTMSGVTSGVSTLSFDGEGTTGTVGSLVAGSDGSSTVSITNGAQVSADVATVGLRGAASMEVSGADSRFDVTRVDTNFVVGGDNEGSLTVRDGGTVTAAGNMYFGIRDGSEGTLTIEGANSLVQVGDIVGFGEDAGITGRASISNGGTYEARRTLLGWEVGGNGIMEATGEGTRISVGSYMMVGFSGTGELTLSDGATMGESVGAGTTNLLIAFSDGSTGTVNIGNARGSAARGAGNVAVDNVSFRSGTGELVFNHNTEGYTFGAAIEGSGTLAHLAGDTTLSGDNNLFAGTTNVEGGTLRVTGEMGGALNVSDGGTSTEGAHVAFEGGQATGTFGSTTTIGGTGDGTLVVTGGATVTSGGTGSNPAVTVGSQASASGTMTISGVGSSLTTTNGALILGNAGTATVNVLDGGSLTASGPTIIGNLAGSVGTLSFDGEGTTGSFDSVGIGNDGTATVSVTNGAQVTSQAISVAEDGPATMSVIGEGSSWEVVANNISVGRRGQGVLNILDGGTVTAANRVSIGENDGGTATMTIDGAGSNLTSAELVNLGFRSGSSGTASVTNGGRLEATQVLLGWQSGSTGELLASGAESRIAVDAYLWAGYEGTGVLTLSDGASVTEADGAGDTALIIGSSAGSTGTVNIGAARGAAATGAGVVALDRVSFGNGTGALVFNHTSDAYTFDARLTGAGTVPHLAGETTLTADNSGFTGTTNVGGGTLRLTNLLGGTLSVSDAGTSDNGASVSFLGAGATGGMSEVTVGDTGDGRVWAGNGAAVTSGAVTLGAQASVTGNLAVSGAEASWTVSSGTVSIGSAGDGTLSLDGGGTLTTEGRISLAENAGSSGAMIIDGSGSTVTADHIHLGERSTATASVTSGGRLQADRVLLGAEAGGSGVLRASGASSRIAAGTEFVVGAQGAGVVTLTEGATLGAVDDTVATVLSIARDAASTGTVNIGAARGAEAAGAGVVTLDGVTFGNGTGELVFNHNTEGYRFALLITGGGTVSHLSGETTLTGDSRGFAGTTNVEGGSLRVTGALGGMLNVSEGGTSGEGASASFDGADAVGDLSGVTVGGTGDGAVSVANGAAVRSGAVTLGAQAAATGGMTVSGSGSDWTVASGALVAGASGSGVISIREGATLTATGRIVLAETAGSSGTLTVDGADSTVTAAELISIGDGASAMASVTGGGRLEAGQMTLGSEDSGSGVLAVSGASSSIAVGTDLVVGAQGNGVVTLSDGASLEAVDGAGETVLSIAHQAGSTGTVNIGAARGTAATGAGAVTLDRVSFGAGVGELVFNHNTEGYQFAPIITGTGTVLHLAGETTLAGNSSGFTGTTNVEGGHLRVAGTLGGTLNVSGGGSVGGDGVVSDLHVNAGGRLTPEGTLRAEGDVSFGSGAEYLVDADAAAQDLLSVTGTLTLLGGTVLHQETTAAFDPTSRYRIAVADGGVQGEFDGATTDMVFMNPELSYTDTEVWLDLLRNDVTFEDVAVSSNQLSLAAALSGIDLRDPLVQRLLTMSETSARQAYDQLAGEIHASAASAAVLDAVMFQDLLLKRLRQSFGDSADTTVSRNRADAVKAPGSLAQGLWMEGFGSWSDFDGDGNVAGTHRDLGGFAIGYDLEMPNGLYVGAMASYSNSSIHNDLGASSDSDNVTLGLYLSTGQNRLGFGLTGGALVSWHDVETTRNLSSVGMGTALGNYNAQSASVFVETSYKFQTDSYAFEPFFGLTHVDHNSDDFVETGSGSALSVTGVSAETTYATLGLRGAAQLSGGDQPMSVTGMLGWRHAFGDTSSTQNALLLGNAFSAQGMPIAEDELLIEVGLDLVVAPSSTFNLNYSGRIADGFADHGLRLGLNVAF